MYVGSGTRFAPFSESSTFEGLAVESIELSRCAILVLTHAFGMFVLSMCVHDYRAWVQSINSFHAAKQAFATGLSSQAQHLDLYHIFGLKKRQDTNLGLFLQFVM